MVVCYQNCSYLLWEKLFYWARKTFEIRGWRPRICKLFEITRSIYSNSERSETFSKRSGFALKNWETICIYIFSGALRLITGGGLPLETSDFLENSNFEAIDISSMINEQYQGFSSNMTINITSACDLIPPFPTRMWGAVSTLGLVSTFCLSGVVVGHFESGLKNPQKTSKKTS